MCRDKKYKLCGLSLRAVIRFFSHFCARQRMTLFEQTRRHKNNRVSKNTMLPLKSSLTYFLITSKEVNTIIGVKDLCPFLRPHNNKHDTLQSTCNDFIKNNPEKTPIIGVDISMFIVINLSTKRVLE